MIPKQRVQDGGNTSFKLGKVLKYAVPLLEVAALGIVLVAGTAYGKGKPTEKPRVEEPGSPPVLLPMRGDPQGLGALLVPSYAAGRKGRYTFEVGGLPLDETRISVREPVPDELIPVEVTLSEVTAAKRGAEVLRIPIPFLEKHTIGDYTFSAARMAGTNLLLVVDNLGRYGLFQGTKIPMAIQDNCPGVDVAPDHARVANLGDVLDRDFLNPRDNPDLKSRQIGISFDGKFLFPTFERSTASGVCAKKVAINWSMALWTVGEGPFVGNLEFLRLYRTYYQKEGVQRPMFIAAHDNGAVFAVAFDDDSKPSYVHHLALQPEVVRKGHYEVGIQAIKGTDGHDHISLLLLPADPTDQSFITTMVPATRQTPGPRYLNVLTDL